jgi:transcriptional regulator with XRE-family HTH domain
MTEVRPDLRALIIRARKDPTRWGKKKGLSQDEAASKAGTSQVWLRQIETGYTRTAKADTLGSISLALGVPSRVIRSLGYHDVADSMDAAELLTELSPEERMPVPAQEDEAEQHLNVTPGLTDDEKQQLVAALRDIRHLEPLGRDIWRKKTWNNSK